MTGPEQSRTRLLQGRYALTYLGDALVGLALDAQPPASISGAYTDRPVFKSLFSLKVRTSYVLSFHLYGVQILGDRQE